MDDQESSSSLMIGMIVGGIVAAVLLIVVVAFGGVFFWLHEDRMVGPPGGPVLVEGPIVEDAAPEPPPPPIAPALARALDRNEQKLIGVWHAKTPNGESRTLDFRADRTLLATAGGEENQAITTFRWELIEIEVAGIVLRRFPKQGEDPQRVIRFVDHDSFNLEIPDGWELYQRRPKEKP